MTGDTFAYGANQLSNCECPAIAADYPIQTGVATVTEQYDIEAGRRRFEAQGGDPDDLPDDQAQLVHELAVAGYGGGTISADDARKAWLAATNAVVTDTATEAGKAVARELGWLDDE